MNNLKDSPLMYAIVRQCVDSLAERKKILEGILKEYENKSQEFNNKSDEVKNMLGKISVDDVSELLKDKLLENFEHI